MLRAASHRPKNRSSSLALHERFTSMPIYGDKGKVIFANIVARMWQDSDFEQQFKADPKAALAADGIMLPDAMEVVLLYNTENVHYVKLPHQTEMTLAIADIHARAPYIAVIPLGHEIRLVRDTEIHQHVVIPHKPSAFDPKAMTHDALAAAVISIQAGDSVANVNVNANVNANTNGGVNVNAGVNANVGAVEVGVVIVAT
jgi:hypothetical protein